jgi:predicted Fe-Mo cluster-binding NifX family protein
MKIAIVTDDEKTISQHFGRATHYAIVTVQNNKVVDQEIRKKIGHRDFQREGLEDSPDQQDPRSRGFGAHSEQKHQRMFSAINDCDVLLARGMGRGAYLGLKSSGIRPILTTIAEIEPAVQAVIEGKIVDHSERLH